MSAKKKKSPSAKKAKPEISDEHKTELNKLFEDSLADILYAEKALTKALPKMAKAAGHDHLKTAIKEHLEETKGQVDRLKEVFSVIGKTARSKECKAIVGLLAEADELAEEFGDSVAIDAAVIAACQKVEHYEIATYGTLVAWARTLGLDEAADLLEETLNEEKSADEKLTELAEGVCNGEAQEE